MSSPGVVLVEDNIKMHCAILVIKVAKEKEVRKCRLRDNNECKLK